MHYSVNHHILGGFTHHSDLGVVHGTFGGQCGVQRDGVQEHKCQDS